MAHMDPQLENESDANGEPLSRVFVPPSIHYNDLVAGRSYTYATAVPEQVTISERPESAQGQYRTGTECVLGIDEAGRGPVLGPMIYGAFYLPIELHHSLLASTHHFDDSKVLTPAIRTRLTKAVCTNGTDLFKSCGWAIRSLSAQDISAGMLKNGGSYNLNAQAMDATVDLIRGIIEQGVNVRELYVDTIGSPLVYQKQLERVFPTIKIQVEKKADSLFPCVSAASVVAKVSRDVSCETLYEEYMRRVRLKTPGKDIVGWGSGYPSDARCMAWVQLNMNPLFGWGTECRFSWGTAKDLLEVKATGALKADWPANEDDENRHMSDFFGAVEDSGSGNDVTQLRTWFGTTVGQEAF